ncbi:MAG: hypothetical protein ACREYF_13620 [Gammaproteobacteria bacterium]
MFERYSFFAITTKDLAAARRFWVERFAVTEEGPGEFFIVNACGLRLCVDLTVNRLRVLCLVAMGGA